MALQDYFFFIKHRLYKLLTNSFTSPMLSNIGEKEQPVLAILSANISANDTTIPCNFHRVPPEFGFTWIDKELIYFESDRGVTPELKNCIRNVNGILNGHTSGTDMFVVPNAESELSRMVRVYEQTLDLLYEKIIDFIDIKNIDRMPINILPFQSEELGWALNVSKTIAFQRKWIKLLVPMYKRKGTKIGIKQIVYFLTGFKGQVINYFDSSWFLERHLFHNIGHEYSFNITSISRDLVGVVTIITDEQSCGTIAEVLSTNSETFDIRAANFNNFFKIRIDNDRGFWTEFEVEIPDKIDYTAKELATVIRNKTYTEGISYSDDSGNIKIEMDIVGKDRKFEIMPIVDSCYVTVGLTSGIEYVGTNGLVARNLISISHDNWTINSGKEEIEEIVNSNTFKIYTNFLNDPIFELGGKLYYVDSRPFVTHVVKTGGDKDEIVKMLLFQKPASSRNHVIWTLFYDDFSQDLAGGITPYWETVLGTVILNEETETLELISNPGEKAIRTTSIIGDYSWKRYTVYTSILLKNTAQVVEKIVSNTGDVLITDSGLELVAATMENTIIVGVIGKYQDENNYYCVEINSTAQTVNLIKVIAGIKYILHSTDYTSLSIPLPQIFTYEDFYRLRLDCELLPNTTKEVLFFDTFDEGNLYWDIIQFPVSFTNGLMIEQNSCAFLNQEVSDPLQWTHALYNLQIKTTSNARAEILFCMQPTVDSLGNNTWLENECYVVHFEPVANRIKLSKRYEDSVLGHIEIDLATIPIILHQETIYIVWIEFWENEIRVSLDGDKIIDVIDNTYLSGNFGIRSTDIGLTKIDEIEITQLDAASAVTHEIDDFNDYRSFAENLIYVGHNFWLVDDSYVAPATELKYYIEENYLGSVIDQTFFTGKAGIVKEVGDVEFKDFEVIEIPKDELVIAYNKELDI